MSEQEKKPSTGKDTTKAEPAKKPEQQTAEKAGQNKPVAQKHSKPKTGGGPGLIMWVLVVVVIAAAAWGAFGYIKKYQSQISQLAVQQKELQNQNTKLQDEFASKWSILKQQQDDLTSHINTLRDKNRHLRKDWLLLEAEYLIQLANHRLLLERDVNTAIAALNSADIRLRDTGDPGLITVRKVITEAIHALKQVPQSDLAGLSLSLSTLNRDIEKLPLATPDPKSKEHEQSLKEAESRHVESWSELPAAIWRDLKGLVVIRDHEAPVQPLLSPEQRFFLVENLRLQLEQARLAMLSGQAEVYKERIATAITWINQHFDRESPLTKSTIDALQQLQGAAIAPELPDIAGAYRALQSYRTGSQDTVSPEPTKATEETGQGN